MYRHLLREASYLPSPARPHIERLIKLRVRRLKDEENPKPHIQHGHSKLRALRAANGGDLARMQRVLQHAFGRRGKRRRELWDKFMYSEPRQVEEPPFHPKRPTNDVATKRNPDFLDRWDLDKLTAFLQSQAAHTGEKFVHPEQHVPTESIWGLPLVPELARSKLRKEWIKAVQRILPPIPRTEWETLRDIVENKASKKVFSVPKRRPVAQTLLDIEPVQEKWEWLPYAIKSVQGLGSQASRRNRLLSGAVDEDTPTGPPPVIGVHKFTARVWRRMFLDIWEKCAYIEKDPGTQKWKFTWGKLPALPPPPSHKPFLKFFADAEARGMGQKISRKKPPTKAKLPSNEAREEGVQGSGKNGSALEAAAK